MRETVSFQDTQPLRFLPENYERVRVRPVLGICASLCPVRGFHLPVVRDIRDDNSKGVIMENPATWSEAEEIVHDVYMEWAENRNLPAGERKIGLSLERSITDALRSAGLLKEKA